MPARGVITRVAFLSLASLFALACGGEEERKKPFQATGGNGGTGGAGGSVGGSGGLGGSAGAGGATGGSGGGSTTCGDGQLQTDEECDGTNLNNTTCADYGFPSGTLICLANCKLDTSQCAGVEHCADAIDNDKDGATDCIDTDCTANCANACATPLPIPDPATVSGSTEGHADSTSASCSAGNSGPDVAYAVTMAKTGVFEAILGTFDPLSLSIRTSCASGSSELGCTGTKRLTFPVTQGTQLFVVVDGTAGGTTGSYGLSVQSRVVACGDAHRDDPEVCDDGNSDSGDGCSATCTLEPDETEPNDANAQANPFKALFVGSISGAADVDVMQVDVPQANTTFNVAILDLGDGSCEYDEVDTLVELRSSSNALITSDDDGADGKCSGFTQLGVGAGTYYVVVKGAPGANPASFAYKLFVSLN